MRLGGSNNLWQVARQFKHRFFPEALILMYHRVIELPSDPYALCVAPRHFAEHLEILRKHTQPVRLQHLPQMLGDGELPQQAVALTFDDGYADNLYNAKPLLERYDMPATVFVTTGYIGNEYEFWWDELERLVLQSGTLPAALSLNMKDHTYHWELDEAAQPSKTMDQRRRCRSTSEQTHPKPCQSLHRALYQLLYPLPDEEKWKILADLRMWAHESAMIRPTHRTLSSHEVLQLATGELVEVGAHTVTHPVLATLSEAAQGAEIQRSKVDLEEILGYPVAGFSYPHGSHTTKTVAAVRDAGFAYACSGVGVVRRGANCLRLPRVVVQDWDGEGFARQLEDWFRD